MCVNNLPKVVTWQCTGWELNQQTWGHQSDTSKPHTSNLRILKARTKKQKHEMTGSQPVDHYSLRAHFILFQPIHQSIWQPAVSGSQYTLTTWFPHFCWQKFQDFLGPSERFLGSSWRMPDCQCSNILYIQSLILCTKAYGTKLVSSLYFSKVNAMPVLHTVY